MKPEFALSLSFEGISLLFREPEGWRDLGDVDLEAEDLDAALAGLRSKALALSPDGVACGIIIPNDQIRYTDLPDPGGDSAAQERAARRALEGKTPSASSHTRQSRLEVLIQAATGTANLDAAMA